ncbi:hypothetical protein DL771_006659 [Monosporascus sp. 5C6A]|nr:hypothetical protein DL771_006659 [Monosporascus sp. 5C6A]
MLPPSPSSAVETPRQFSVPAAPYSRRPPSPPSIIIPGPVIYNNEPIKVVPSYENVDPASLSVDDLRIITQNGKELIAHDSATNWAYENRRTAQSVLDYLYLGPASVARDRQWLRDNGITLLVAARDSRMAGLRLMGVDRVAKELGIQAEHIDVSGHHELIRAFPMIVRKINDHMLSVYRSQAVRDDEGARAQGGNMVIDKASFKRGRVLVFCETGNDRSAGIVVAYLMSVMGMSMVQACQFIHFRRFCVSLDEELKQLLKNYEEILTAQRTVHRHEMDTAAHGAAPGFATPVKKGKRGIEETMRGDGEDDETTDPFSMDRDRYIGREAFVPFVDTREVTMEH